MRVGRRSVSKIVVISAIVIPRRMMRTMTVTGPRVIRMIHMRMGVDRRLVRSFGLLVSRVRRRAE